MGSLFTRGGPLLRGAALAGAGALGYRLGRRARDRTPRPTPVPTPVPTPLVDPGESTFVVAELERLTRLLDQGALSQPEFEAAKRELLEGV